MKTKSKRNTDEAWAREAASALKTNMTTEEIAYLKTSTNPLNIAGKETPIPKKCDPIIQSLMKAENAAIRVINDYYTKLIKQYL